MDNLSKPDSLKAESGDVCQMPDVAPCPKACAWADKDPEKVLRAPDFSSTIIWINYFLVLALNRTRRRDPSWIFWSLSFGTGDASRLAKTVGRRDAREAKSQPCLGRGLGRLSSD